MSTVRIDGGATLGQYEYDPFGRRTKKVTASGTRYFHYDDTGLLAEYDASGNLISEYQYKPGSTWMTNPLFKRDATNKVHYYYNSHLGQPLKLFDRSGRITWEGRSQAFGKTTAVIEETENNLRFPGQYEDQETGLYYNYFRYYQASSGRYMRADPVGMKGGLNLYSYAKMNPAHYSDSYGLFSQGHGLPVYSGSDVVAKAEQIKRDAAREGFCVEIDKEFNAACYEKFEQSYDNFPPEVQEADKVRCAGGDLSSCARDSGPTMAAGIALCWVISIRIVPCDDCQ